ncbi:MAG: hypothetical protein M1829_002563 [Trizodia sp. TS-e1964]|nr:MAG: hypothetical protein M1829_002563 [Trizodia sp. TS-e1964]
MPDFRFWSFFAGERAKVADKAGEKGYSHFLISAEAEISHLKLKKEHKIVDLKPESGWEKVKKMVDIYHSGGKTDIEVQITFKFARKRAGGRDDSESEDILTRKPAPKKQKSQELSKAIQEGLDSAAQARSSENSKSEVLLLVDELFSRYKWLTKQCPNFDHTCTIIRDNRHVTLSLTDLN